MTGGALWARLAHGCAALRAFDWHTLSEPETCGDWPGVVKCLLLLGLAGLLLGLGYGLYLRGMQQQWSDAIGQEAALRATLATKTTLTRQRANYAQQVRTLSARVTALRNRLPAQADVPALLEDMARAGSGHGLVLTDLRLQPERLESLHHILPMTLSMRGAYHDFGAFVSAIAGLPSIVALQDFTITADGDRSALMIALSAVTYRRDAADDDTSARAALTDAMPSDSHVPFVYGAAGLRAPFVLPVPEVLSEQHTRQGPGRPDPARVREPLETVALASLRLVGTLQRGGRIWALIGDKAGTVTRVTVGAYLGRKHGRIVHIAENRLELMELVPAGDGRWLEQPQSLLLSR